MTYRGDCESAEIAVPLHPETFINFKKGKKVMKTMNQMRMREYCCSPMMMAMTMKEGVYIDQFHNFPAKEHSRDQNECRKTCGSIWA